MHTYFKLKDDRIYVLYSDNTAEETMHGYPLAKRGSFDPEWDTLDKFSYAEIAIVDSNLWVVENL